jgi:secreted trypsin-like serine protease
MQIFKELTIALLGAAALTLGINATARAIVTFDEDAQLSLLLAPGQFSGVARLELGVDALTGDSSGGCTGSLLRGGLHLLTAAHCLTDDNGLLDPELTVNPSFAYFNLMAGVMPIAIQDFFIQPNWSGDLAIGNDIAIVLLAEPAPTEAEQYDLYRNTDEVGQTFTTVGYGYPGIGALGEFEVDLPIGFYGLNQFDATEAILPTLLDEPVIAVSGSQLLFDFDNGFSDSNALGGLGLGRAEVNIARGDSGGPALIGDRIAGITSYGIGYPFLLTDIDLDTNGSFGELGGKTRVSTYASFVDAVLAGQVDSELGTVAAIPEPTTILGTLTVGAWFLKRRQQKHRTKD